MFRVDLSDIFLVTLRYSSVILCQKRIAQRFSCLFKNMRQQNRVRQTIKIERKCLINKLSIRLNSDNSTETFDGHIKP